ncbi:NAD-P-binding protein [Lentinus tigrinus ALCF2SS1-6]|uniref:NAD-P-binding protein n=1 Tax=Lentinus tigrinus ALCF2SS1-6 TaxID=1328759 RepID=A0A5C2S4Q8_9APHY|nr:NAD-P-binding protein [Lentinus tigrinus ALCF2SS1-6]
MPSYAVIGASRGIGLAYVRQLATRPDTTVFAIVRNASASTHLTKATAGLKNVHVVEADIADYASVERAAKQVAKVTGGTLDVLIHNAARTDPATIYLGFDQLYVVAASYAVYSRSRDAPTPSPSMDALDADFIEAYKINALGVIHSIAAFLPLLRASTAPTKKVVVISTPGADLNFIRAAGVGDMAAYGITKAAGLMAATKYAVKLKDEGFVVVSLAPGVVDTGETMGESGNPDASAGVAQFVEGMNAKGIPMELLTPEQSVAAQLKTIDALTLEQNGAFLNYTGEEWSL